MSELFIIRKYVFINFYFHVMIPQIQALMSLLTGCALGRDDGGVHVFVYGQLIFFPSYQKKQPSIFEPAVTSKVPAFFTFNLHHCSGISMLIQIDF